MDTSVSLTAPSAPESRSRSRIRALIRRFDRVLFIVLLIMLWEAVVDKGYVDSSLLPPPHGIAQTLYEMAKTGSLWSDLGASLSRVVIGFIIATVVALFAALACYLFPWVSRLLTPLIELLRPISVIAWIPLAILWFGLGDKPAWFLIFLGAFFPIFTNTLSGALALDKIYVNAALCLGVNKRLFVKRVLIPAVIPYALTGMKIGLGVGWMCVIAAEMIAAQSGLGYMIQVARSMIDTQTVIAGMLVIGIAGYVMNYLMSLLEKRFMKWKT